MAKSTSITLADNIIFMSQNNETPLLSIQDLTVKFKTQEELITAVNHVSFDIPKGKTVGLVGESGYNGINSHASWANCFRQNFVSW